MDVNSWGHMHKLIFGPYFSNCFIGQFIVHDLVDYDINPINFLFMSSVN